MQLPCCCQFLHRRCYLRWRQTNHATCPMCRDLQHQPPVPPPPPPAPVEINQDLIDRFRTLLQAPDFEQQLNQVRHFFILLSLSLSLSLIPHHFSSVSLSRFQITSPRPCSLPLAKFYILLLIHALENSLRHTDLFLRFTVRASGTRSRFLHTTSQVFGFLLGRSAFRFQLLIDS